MFAAEDLSSKIHIASSCRQQMMDKHDLVPLPRATMLSSLALRIQQER